MKEYFKYFLKKKQHRNQYMLRMQVAGSPIQSPDRPQDIVESPTNLYPLLQRMTQVDPVL